MSIYVDFHVLQTVPPSCVNRDDTGSPKTAVYGGTVRARVSSQAWKHAMRKEFKTLFAEEELANRTKCVVEMVEKEMYKIDASLDKDECHKKAIAALESAGLPVKAPKKSDPEKSDTSKAPKKDESEKAEALFFMSYKQAAALAEHALSLDFKADKKIFQNDLKENLSVEIALFGRMVASDPNLNCDAAAQVAHAISTHSVQNEYDYFTAVDDLQSEDNAGAGHLGTVEFNSSTLYRYANVNASELVKTIGKESAAEAVRKFADAFIRSMPTGKENTFANRTFPDVIYVTVRSDQPVNLSGAFEAAVKEKGNGYLNESENKLIEYAEKVYSRYASEPDASFGIGNHIGEISENMPLPELLSKLEITVNQKLAEV